MNRRILTVAALVPTLALFGRETALYDIVPYSPGREAATARDILAAHATAGLDTFLYSVSLDPRGLPAFDNVKTATASYRRLKDEVERAGGKGKIRLGFLLQSILGHWPRVDREIEPWQRSINEFGEAKRFCIRDPRYQDYIRRTGAALAAEKPCFILGDDDIRAFSGKLECFCPLHTAEFNRRAGTNFTPEEYRAAVKACREGDRVATVCAQLRDEIPMTAVRLLREGIDSVDPSVPGGVCMPGAEQALVAPRAKLMAGAGNPVTVRLANGQYSELGRESFVSIALRTLSFVEFYRPSVDTILDESDTFPHTLYARGGRSFIAKLAMGFFCGLNGAKLWFVGMHKGAERVPSAYDRALGANRRLLASLATALDGSVPLGVRIPAVRSAVPLHAGSPRFFADETWPLFVLGVYGIPFRPDFSRAPGEPVLLGGRDNAARLTDGELEELFRGRVFVDGPAALQLADRGKAGLLGCTPVADGRAFNIERIRANGVRPPISKSPLVPCLTDVAAGARIHSDLCFSAIGREPDVVSAGAISFANPSGGTTFTASFDASYGCTMQNLRRKAWLTDAIRTLDPAFPPVSANDEPNMTLARRGRDGRTYVFSLNLGYDDIESLRYRTARPMDGAEALGADGVWRKAGAAREGDVWSVPLRLPCAGFAILRH